MASLVQLPRRKPSAPVGVSVPRVVVLGNPNAGKTTLFNRLAGTNLRVGNYPGVTVEHAVAELRLPDGQAVELVDLPGTYSLCGRSAEERIAIHALLGIEGHSAPDAVLVVGDVTQLQRSLYLALQAMELGLPVLVALNMADEADGLGIDVDVAGLGDALGVPVVACSARTGAGLDTLRTRLSWTCQHPDRAVAEFRTALPARFEGAVAEAAEALEGWIPGSRGRRALGVWALMSVEGGAEDPSPPDVVSTVTRLRAGLEAAGLDLDDAVARSRYAHLDELVARFVRATPGNGPTLTDRIDRVLIHPVWGFGVFVVLMTLLFQGLFSWSDPAISAIEAFFGLLSDGIVAAVPAGLGRDFVVDGLIAGVGGVVVFLPQILLLFLLIGLMEDSGYMSRVAYLMDRVMRSVGLHGRAFVPMLSGFACAVPAVLATRTMERRRDRLLTMMVVPLTTCSARLPVYTLLIAALFPEVVLGIPARGLVLSLMYFLSVFTALAAAAVLGRTLLKGRREPLLLELPPYRLPRAATVLRMMWDRSRVFLSEAGTVILVCTVVLWGLLTFPRVDVASVPDGVAPETAQIEGSYAASLGKAIEPAIAPLGFDWTIGIGLIGSFAAREVFVATMGVVYGVGSDVDEESTTLRERMQSQKRSDGTPVYTPLVGLSLMMFFAFAAQCMSTLAAVKRETKSWRWPIFLTLYMTGLAYLAALVVYQGGRALGFG
jgi:ferrous iron transport protein B